MNLFPWRRPLIQDSDIDNGDGNEAQSLPLFIEPPPPPSHQAESRECNKMACSIIMCSIVVILAGSQWLFLHR
jgi:hypothetical protein